ncbi:MAG: sigma-70 family RNA polymerase sigma factor [Aestuariivirga sp.]
MLLASARRDAAAFAELVSRYYKPVYRMVWRMLNGNAETEDVAQEAFVKLWQNPAQVREAKALKGWLMRVASNLAIDRLRRKPHADIDAIEEQADPRQQTGRELEERAATMRVNQAIAGLPERQKLAVTLVHLEGMSNMAAAQVMDISVEAVESLLGRGRRALRESLAEDWRGLLDELSSNVG